MGSHFLSLSLSFFTYKVGLITALPSLASQACLERQRRWCKQKRLVRTASAAAGHGPGFTTDAGMRECPSDLETSEALVSFLSSLSLFPSQ